MANMKPRHSAVWRWERKAIAKRGAVTRKGT